MSNNYQKQVQIPDNTPETESKRLTRRDFTKMTAVALPAAMVAGCATSQTIMKSKPDTLRVGVVGCGGRGIGAAIDSVQSSEAVEIVALGDLFEDRLKGGLKRLHDTLDKDDETRGSVKVTPDRCFTGFSNFEGVLSCDIDLVILGTPPGFRPQHLEAAILANKHVFMEKPVAVDPVGVRSVIATSELAQTKGLAIVSGTQRRHDASYIETMRRIHDGAIGELVGGQCYWNQGTLWVRERKPEMSDMEWQCRNWLYFTWLSGDHICEQHIHNLDVINWAMQSPPVKATGMGGREVRKGTQHGNIFDHFAIEYEYPNGARVMSMCRQIKGCTDNVSERLVGTRGTANTANGIIETRRGEWKYDKEHRDPYVQEHADLIASIRAGEPLNEGRRVAESTMTAIMGRMSAYTGRAVSWKWAMNSSKLDLTPPHYEFGDLPVRPVSVPGVTQLV